MINIITSLNGLSLHGHLLYYNWKQAYIGNDGEQKDLARLGGR